MGYFASGSNSYEEVAKKAELDEKTTKRYIAYMRKRWPNSENEKCQVGYAGEWALRFKDGIEYTASDSEGQHILNRLKCE